MNTRYIYFDETKRFTDILIEGKITRPIFFLRINFSIFRKLFALTIFYELNLGIFILVRPVSFSSGV
jgi:hypothetical protein